MRYLRYMWRVFGGLVYLGFVIAILSASTTKFETLVLAGMVQIYAAVLYNSSVIGVATDSNNYAAFVRFRVLAAAQGVTENEDGTFADQEKALADLLTGSATPMLISRIANAAVSLYALFKIVQALSFA